MMAATLPAPPSPPSFVDPPLPQSLLLYPALIDQTTPADLSLQLRNRNYNEYRDIVTGIQLDRLLLANALVARLASVLYYAQTLLVQLIVQNTTSGDISEFSVINEATQDLRKSVITKCTAPVESIIQGTRSQQDRMSSTKSFINELSPTAANTLLKFISTLRGDPTFLSDRLLRTTDQELDSLVLWKPHHHASDTVARNSAATSSADYVVSFHRHDPLYALTSVIFPAPSVPKSFESQLRMQCWSTCLANLIDARRASQLVSRVFHLFAGTEWQVSARFETIILSFLQNVAALRSRGDVGDEDFVDPVMTNLLDKSLVEVLSILKSGEGIPSSALDLLKTVYQQCTDKEYAKSYLLDWVLHDFLAEALVHPEYRGLLMDSYLGEDQRISLETLASRLKQHVETLNSPSTELTDTSLAIQMHLDDLEARLFTTHPRVQQKDDLPPPQTCPQPTIVLCPADVLTIFYALYPKFRPQAPSIPSPHPPSTRHTRKPSEGSPKPEYKRPSSEYLRPILKKTHMFDLNDSSVSSQSELSAPSEEETLDVEREEIDMYALSVKSAIDEMKRRLGPEGCLGERYPCDEMWTTLYVSEDALSLSPTPDFEQADAAQDDGPVIISKEDDAIIQRALIKLAETTSSLPTRRRHPIPEETPIVRLPPSIHHEDLMSLLSPRIAPSQSQITINIVGESKLLSSLRDASQKSYSRGEYIEAHSFQHAYHLLKSIVDIRFSQNDYSPIIGMIAAKVQNRGNHHLSLVRTREVWFSQLLADRANLDTSITRLTAGLTQVRCKMWYVHHVRESKVWQRAKDVCKALEKMKSSKPGQVGNSEAPTLKRKSSGASLHRSNSVTRNPGSRFIPSRQSLDGFSFSGRPASLYNVSLGMGSDDWFDLLAAPKEQGGPHKLSDYQVEITNRWLEEHASETFCRGEEIIHRFMAEIDDVVRRLIPETVDEMTSIASTFWESEEFLEDAKELGLLGVEKRMPSKRDEGYSSHGRRSEEIPRNSSGADLLGMLNRSRGKTVGADTSDVRSIRPGHTRTTSMTVNTRSAPEVLVRPGSSHSSSFPPPSPATSFFSRQHLPPPTPMSRCVSQIDEKAANEFLEKTKQHTIGLLLSDLGREIWSRGSETDEWFSDGLADSCLERQRTRQKAAVERAAGKGKKVASVTGTARRPSVRGFSFEDEPPTPPLSRETSDTGNPDFNTINFDYKAGYKELLRRFSVSPTPQEKLKSLFSLERLIHASFASISGPSGSEFAGPVRLPTPRPSMDMTRKASTSSAVGTDELIDKLQEILRDPELRPKTLFRDLSFVSAFINPITLTHQGEGKVFWDIGLAALGMKEDVVSAMVSWYEEIMSGNERSRARRRGTAPASIGGMNDAARMLVIAACEGNAIGQRELALLHLSHPSLLPLTTLPLSRPSDTFHKVNLKGSATDRDKYDPDRIALATHWFKLAAKNGDKYAKNVEGNWLGSKKH